MPGDSDTVMSACCVRDLLSGSGGVPVSVDDVRDETA